MTNEQIAALGYEVVFNGCVREPGTPLPEWRETAEGHAYTQAREARSADRRRKRQRAKAGDVRVAILKAITGEALKADQIATGLGTTRATISTILSRLVASGEVVVVERVGRYKAGRYRVAA